MKIIRKIYNLKNKIKIKKIKKIVHLIVIMMINNKTKITKVRKTKNIVILMIQRAQNLKIKKIFPKIMNYKMKSNLKNNLKMIHHHFDF